MKKFIAIIALAFTFSAQAQESEYSKFNMCMDAGIIASQAYTIKTHNVKLDYPRFDDLIVAVFMKQAIDTGYNAKSRKEAVDKAYAKCANNKLWAAIKGFDE
jgi:hypothetical protein